MKKRMTYEEWKASQTKENALREAQVLMESFFTVTSAPADCAAGIDSEGIKKVRQAMVSQMKVREVCDIFSKIEGMLQICRQSEIEGNQEICDKTKTIIGDLFDLAVLKTNAVRDEIVPKVEPVAMPEEVPMQPAPSIRDDVPPLNAKANNPQDFPPIGRGDMGGDSQVGAVGADDLDSISLV